MDKKKIVLIILFVAATLLIAYGIYYFFWRKAPAPLPFANLPVNVAPGVLPIANIGAPTGINVPSTVTPLPTASSIARGGLTQTTIINDANTLNPSLSSDGNNVNFYNPQEGKFYRITSTGQTQLLSTQTFYNVQKVTWGPQSDKAILEYPDNSKVFYDFNAAKQVTLPKHWEGFSFSPQGDQITAKSVALDPDNRFLIISDPDGANAQPILPTGQNQDKVQMTWSPNGSVIAFSDTGRPQGFGRKQIIPIGKNGETFNPLIVEGFEFQPQWSKNGDKLVYSTYNTDSSYKPTLWITNADPANMGTDRHKLNVETWANKCTFADNSVLYCAVPEKLDEGAGLVPDLAKGIPDLLYKIDLKTNLKNLVAKPEGNYSMDNLIISNDNSTLFFTDANGALHKMNLK